MSSLINKRIALNLRDARLMRNYSQEYIALQLKVSQNAYSKMEMGRTLITVETVFKIANILEVDIHTLLNIKQLIVA
jgi:transcriptional regulator with XRE-family HTH domain